MNIVAENKLLLLMICKFKALLLGHFMQIDPFMRSKLKSMEEVTRGDQFWLDCSANHFIKKSLWLGAVRPMHCIGKNYPNPAI